jgi:ACR3 family arsenite transporter
VIGIALGQFCLAPFQAIARAEVAQIHLPVAVLIWLMVIPMLMKNDFGALSTPTEFFREVECAPWD